MYICNFFSYRLWSILTNICIYNKDVKYFIDIKEETRKEEAVRIATWVVYIHVYNIVGKHARVLLDSPRFTAYLVYALSLRRFILSSRLGVNFPWFTTSYWCYHFLPSALPLWIFIAGYVTLFCVHLRYGQISTSVEYTVKPLRFVM